MTHGRLKIDDKMQSVKSACINAPNGPEKDAALKHYRAAEQAHSAMNEAETLKALDAARQALSFHREILPTEGAAGLSADGHLSISAAARSDPDK